LSTSCVFHFQWIDTYGAIQLPELIRACIGAILMLVASYFEKVKQGIKQNYLRCPALSEEPG